MEHNDGYLSDVPTIDSRAHSEVSQDLIVSTKTLEKHFRDKYTILRSSYEERLKKMSEMIAKTCESLLTDEIIREMKNDKISSYFIPSHAGEIIERHLDSEREKVIHELFARISELESHLAAKNKEWHSKSLEITEKEKNHKEKIMKQSLQIQSLQSQLSKCLQENEKCKSYITQRDHDWHFLEKSLKENTHTLNKTEYHGKQQQQELMTLKQQVEMVQKEKDVYYQESLAQKLKITSLTEEVTLHTSTREQSHLEEELTKKRIHHLMSEMEKTLQQEMTANNETVSLYYDKLKTFKQKLLLELSKEKQVNASLSEELFFLKNRKEEHSREVSSLQLQLEGLQTKYMTENEKALHLQSQVTTLQESIIGYKQKIHEYEVSNHLLQEKYDHLVNNHHNHFTLKEEKSKLEIKEQMAMEARQVEQTAVAYKLHYENELQKLQHALHNHNNNNNNLNNNNNNHNNHLNASYDHSRIIHPPAHIATNNSLHHSAVNASLSQLPPPLLPPPSKPQQLPSSSLQHYPFLLQDLHLQQVISDIHTTYQQQLANKQQELLDNKHTLKDKYHRLLTHQTSELKLTYEEKLSQMSSLLKEGMMNIDKLKGMVKESKTVIALQNQRLVHYQQQIDTLQKQVVIGHHSGGSIVTGGLRHGGGGSGGTGSRHASPMRQQPQQQQIVASNSSSGSSRPQKPPMMSHSVQTDNGPTSSNLLLMTPNPTATATATAPSTAATAVINSSRPNRVQLVDSSVNTLPAYPTSAPKQLQHAWTNTLGSSTIAKNDSAAIYTTYAPNNSEEEGIYHHDSSNHNHYDIGTSGPGPGPGSSSSTAAAAIVASALEEARQYKLQILTLEEENLRLQARINLAEEAGRFLTTNHFAQIDSPIKLPQAPAGQGHGGSDGQQQQHGQQPDEQQQPQGDEEGDQDSSEVLPSYTSLLSLQEKLKQALAYNTAWEEKYTYQSQLLTLAEEALKKERDHSLYYRNKHTKTTSTILLTIHQQYSLTIYHLRQDLLAIKQKISQELPTYLQRESIVTMNHCKLLFTQVFTKLMKQRQAKEQALRIQLTNLHSEDMSILESKFIQQVNKLQQSHSVELTRLHEELVARTERALNASVTQELIIATTTSNHSDGRSNSGRISSGGWNSSTVLANSLDVSRYFHANTSGSSGSSGLITAAGSGSAGGGGAYESVLKGILQGLQDQEAISSQSFIDQVLALAKMHSEPSFAANAAARAMMGEEIDNFVMKILAKKYHVQDDNDKDGGIAGGSSTSAAMAGFTSLSMLTTGAPGAAAGSKD